MIARVRLCYCEEGIVEYDVKSLEIKPDGTLVLRALDGEEDDYDMGDWEGLEVTPGEIEQ